MIDIHDNYDDFVWEHVVTIDEGGFDLTMDILHEICDRRQLEIEYNELDSGEWEFMIGGPEGLVEDAVEEYFREY